MRRVVLTALLLSSLLAAGCLDTVDGAQRAPVDAPLEGRLGLGLGADAALADTPAPEALVPLAWGWPQWLDGVLAPAWSSAPADQAYVVTGGTATIVYEALRPTSTLGTRPELTIWFGVEERVFDHGFQTGAQSLAPGERTTGVFELALPPGGLIVEPGERLVLRVGSYYADDARTRAVAAVTGGEAGSRLDLQTRPVTLPVPAQAQVDEGVVELRGGRCLGLDPATDADMVWLTFDPSALGDGLVGIDVDVRHLRGEGPPDVDFVLLDAAGEVAAHGAGSAGVEGVRLRAPNLVALDLTGPWALGVYACTPQASEAEWRVALWTG